MAERKPITQARFDVGDLALFRCFPHEPGYAVWIVTQETSDDGDEWMYEFRYTHNPHYVGCPLAYEKELEAPTLLDLLAHEWPYEWRPECGPPGRRRFLRDRPQGRWVRSSDDTVGSRSTTPAP